MHFRRIFTVPSLDLDCLLSAKVKLRQEGLLDVVLEATLQHAMQALQHLPLTKRRDVSLALEGEAQLVRFVAGTPSLHYTVHLGEDGPEFRQKIYTSRSRLMLDDIVGSHFCGHRCQDEFESCLNRVRRTLSDADRDSNIGLSNVELKIVCGELQLTYFTLQPLNSVLIQPPRRVNLGQGLTLEKLLEVKTDLEKSRAVGKGLLACLHYLVVNYSQYQGPSVHITLQGQGEMMELISGQPDDHNTRHYIFTDADNHAQSHKVQDMDVWDYD